MRRRRAGGHLAEGARLVAGARRRAVIRAPPTLEALLLMFMRARVAVAWARSEDAGGAGVLDPARAFRCVGALGADEDEGRDDEDAGRRGERGGAVVFNPVERTVTVVPFSLREIWV